MDNFYFENAKKWYSDLYISPVYSRVYYFLILFLFIFSLYFLFIFYKAIFPLKTKLSIVAKLKHENGKKVSFKKMNYKQVKIGIAEYIIHKAVLQKETLDDSDFAMVVENKLKLMKSFFSENILQEYEMENLEENEDNDLSYAIKGFKKRIEINDIIFLDDKNRDIRNSLMYKLSLFQDTNKAIVFFTSCNDLLEICQKYQAFIEFDISIPDNKDRKIEDRMVKFKIVSFEKQMI